MHTIKRGAKCHDIMDRVGNYWNQNLKLCLKNNGYTQETFAKAYKKQYGTGNQADVYRWLNVGNMSGSSGKRIGLPSYDTMKRIADFFHVTVGYLTGETDYETFEMERACKYFGVSEETGKVLKKTAGSTHDCIEHGDQSDNYQRIIDAFFTSERFSEFIYDLRQLDDAYSEDTLIFKKMELHYGKKALDEVRRLQSDEIDYKHDPNAPKLPELQIEIWNAMEHADDKCYENSFKIKLARYELRESFERLIDSLYPR